MLHTSQRWKQIEILFHEGLALPEESRSGFLKDRCGDDLELRKEVEALLASAREPMDFLEQPVIEAAHDLARESALNRVLTGERIDRYEVVSFIGRGGMGQVYLAVDTRLNRKVAIKILAPALAYDERGLRRFEKEARAASALNHPNILTIFEFGQVENLHFIVSEYVDGYTLRQQLDEGRLELSTAIDIAIQIARALDAAHSSGIVHRDIKPENIVIRADQLVKVVDFGIAKLNKPESQQGIYPQAPALSVSMSQTGMVIGSARYMSPEQARGQAVDPRSDIFSLGVVLYEMVCGKCPFDGETISDVIAEILKGTPQSLTEILPDAPPELEKIASRAMCKDRECRYQSVKQMLADLSELASLLQFQAQFPGNTIDREGQPHLQPAAEPSRSLPTSSTPPGGFRRLIGSRFARLGISLLLLILALTGIFFAVIARRSSAPSAPARARTLAILPFRNLRQDPAVDYLGFSLADEVITELSSVNGLTVRPSSSVYRYRNQSVDPQKVGQDLNVDTLLTGGFIQDGDELRITAQLIDLKPDRILWRDTIDVKFDKLLTVQDRVSQEIVKGLELNLSPAQARNSSSTNPQAYEDYLRGVDLFSINDFPAAIAMLEASVSLDPNYAPAWAHLGKAYAALATLQLGGREQYDKAQSAYEKAIALNPNLVEPRIYMANLLTDTGRVEQAVPLLRTALQISPDNAELHWELGYAYRFAGMLQESVAECERARQIDPQVKINSSEINSYLYLGQYAKFLQSLPNSDAAYVLFYRGLTEYYLKHPDQAARDFDRAYILNPDLLQARIGRALSSAIAGHHDLALELLHRTQDEMEDRGVGDAESMYKIAQVYAVLGDKAASLHALSHTVEGGFFCYSCFEADPLLADIRTEPEFHRLSEDARQRHDQFKSRFF
jgi:serine/threonine protein kinase/Flp pilus assembly protein TadD